MGAAHANIEGSGPMGARVSPAGGAKGMGRGGAGRRFPPGRRARGGSLREMAEGEGSRGGLAGKGSPPSSQKSRRDEQATVTAGTGYPRIKPAAQGTQRAAAAATALSLNLLPAAAQHLQP